MTSPTKNQRIGIVISTVWAVFTLAWSVSDNDMSIFVILGLIPLIIGWGIWWIRRAEATKPERD